MFTSIETVGGDKLREDSTPDNLLRVFISKFGRISVNHEPISPVVQTLRLEKPLVKVVDANYAASAVLQRPEILDIIFGYLESSLITTVDPTKPIDFTRADSIKYYLTKPKLLDCLYVNRLWNKVATPHLYRNSRIGSEQGCRLLNATLSQSSILGHDYGKYIRAIVFVRPPGGSGQALANWPVNDLLQTIGEQCPRIEDINATDISIMEDEALLQVAKNCKRISKLNLNRCDKITSSTVEAFAEAGTQFTSLNLGRSIKAIESNISSESVALLLQNSKRLVELRLRNCKEVNDSALMNFAQHCSQTMILELSWCRLLTDASLLSIGKNCRELRSIALNGCHELTDASLRVILSNSPKLISLSLARSGMMTDELLVEMAPQLKNLNTLSLNGCDSIGDSSIIAVAKHCPNLQNLSLFAIDIGDESLHAIGQYCKSMTCFSISGCNRVTDEGAQNIAELRGLQSLYLNASQITDVTLANISATCKQIKALSLNDCVRVTDGGIIPLVGQLHRLQSLSINKTCITTSGAQLIASFCKSLRELSVKDCPHVKQGDWIYQLQRERALAIVSGTSE